MFFQVWCSLVEFFLIFFLHLSHSLSLVLLLAHISFHTFLNSLSFIVLVLSFVYTTGFLSFSISVSLLHLLDTVSLALSHGIFLFCCLSYTVFDLFQSYSCTYFWATCFPLHDTEDAKKAALAQTTNSNHLLYQSIYLSLIFFVHLDYLLLSRPHCNHTS